MQPNDLRQAYLDFFQERGHVVVPSSPLVPDNDPTTLFTGSGMQPMMPYLIGEPHPLGTRIVDSQKCFRSQDIEEVGDNRHTTFFEMLGNWSLGDYFKEDQLTWFFTFLTNVVKLDPRKLFVTVFRGQPDLDIPRDNEAVEIWQKLFTSKDIDATVVDMAEREGMKHGRIFYYDESKNWWSRTGVPSKMPIGEPGGPDSEVFYDFGADLKLHEHSAFKKLPCHVNCDCGRFMEIGNNVFMTYQRTETGFELLKQKNIDFGGGFERILAAANNDPDVFKTELFTQIITEIEAGSQHASYANDQDRAAIRVIADHLRAATFLIADGVRPSNKAQGYVLRRLLRRSAIKMNQLGGGLKPTECFVKVAHQVMAGYEAYGQYFKPGDDDQVTEVITKELVQFGNSLDKGLKLIEKTPEIDGKVAFDLYQSFGFPLEITLELAQQRGQNVDQAVFTAAFEEHKNRSRSASAGMFKGGLADHSEQTTKYHTATHLLHAALRKILGTHVEQKGSNITGERLRFDFSHPQALSVEEVAAVEKQINDWIAADLPVTKQMMEKQAALDSGAIAFFIEKYPDQVSVYTIGTDPEKGWVSKELCGGPHVTRTGEIGQLKVFKEQAVSAGVRRIYVQ